MTDMKMPSGTRVLNNQGRSLHGPGPVVVEHKHMKFLITDRPTDATLPRYIEDLKRYDAHVVVRVCEPTYNIEQLKKQGIDVLDWAFDDGAAPPKEVVDGWLQLLKKKFKEKPGSCIAVHCVAGLGRAPVLVALALIESGMKYEDAVEFIRRRRRGAINAKQLNYLEQYKPSKLLKEKGSANCCIQ
ncbi:hypothetical protein pdam_00016231 [Pocillopora damicornis]|uniref:Uncharacterized protein n=2 Tax=Pocillopora TaxID=46730 RepID=A0A3M6U0E8_POCDA|nr:protein tyrosine phosphatase type IVA 3-like [Pocillopora damicornis]XP_058951929.1 protein tyrosine phosphatase type IVA 3-like [Pocillopora verrucosa]RMX47155.1 hypothetical protein pdam_00016231 [Pocillopora damicornis]CAH3158292.1 unnamed protein product [Pocillopora meandrina]